MVQVEFMSRIFPPAILTGTLISRIDIKAAKPDLSLGDSVIPDKKNNSRHPDDPVNQPDIFVIHRNREITPALKIERLILVVHRVRNPLIKERKGTTHRRDVDRKVRAIEHQNLRVEHRIPLA